MTSIRLIIMTAATTNDLQTSSIKTLGLLDKNLWKTKLCVQIIKTEEEGG